MMVGEDQIFYNPETDGEQMSLLGENIVVTDEAIIPDEIIGDGELVRASNASYGARVMRGDNPILDVEIFTSDHQAAGQTLEVYPLDGRDKPVVVELPRYYSREDVIPGAVRAVLVAKALGQIES